MASFYGKFLFFVEREACWFVAAALKMIFKRNKTYLKAYSWRIRGNKKPA